MKDRERAAESLRSFRWLFFRVMEELRERAQTCARLSDIKHIKRNGLSGHLKVSGAASRMPLFCRSARTGPKPEEEELEPGSADGSGRGSAPPPLSKRTEGT
ncbi:hypothetical protein FQA47_013212 [Oryzias melastigma]|uniref:Uncharacterized protein n=1 Tax=Oryzias melastigma TaxID=30732 RepID=A0A834FHH5_ORYME|nr:hypothetical protein FQA47_013212 [Oryzias melastigma]